jgi:chromosomal replication initiator protein
MESLKRKLNITKAKRWNGQKSTYKPSKKIWTIANVEKMICIYFDIESELLHIDTRKAEVVRPRQITMFFCKLLCKETTLSMIGSYFGRHHAAVLASCKAVNNLYETDRVLRSQINELSIRFTQLS